MIALVPVRDGALPRGAEEVVAEAGGRALLAGSGTAVAAAALGTRVCALATWEDDAFRPAAWARALAPALRDEDVVLLPASPDGRDLAPRLALALDRPLHAPALLVTPRRVVTIGGGGLLTHDVELSGSAVATLQPGVRGAEPAARSERTPGPGPARLALAFGAVDEADGAVDATVTAVVDADLATMELADAKRVLAAGAGLASQEHVDLLARIAPMLGAVAGATRAVTDAGWMPFERQIGSTGVAVAPELYIGVGISGAVQHTSGIGQPRDVVAVNLDPSCPLMELADLALVTDGPGLLAALAERLEAQGPEVADADDGVPGGTR